MDWLCRNKEAKWTGYNGTERPNQKLYVIGIG